MDIHAICLVIIFIFAVPAAALGESKVPPVEAVQKKAIEYARLDPGEISSWKKRARYQAFLPKLQFDYESRLRDLIDININDSVYVGSNGVVVGPDEGNYSYNNDSHQSVSVMATWNFNEAIFNPDMLDISAESRRLATDRNALLSEVTRNYFDRERFAAELSFMDEDLQKKPDSKKLVRARDLKSLSLDEKTAALDALTGGWFGEELRRLAAGKRRR